jgi:hypothetical protein
MRPRHGAAIDVGEPGQDEQRQKRGTYAVTASATGITIATSVRNTISSSNDAGRQRAERLWIPCSTGRLGAAVVLHPHAGRYNHLTDRIFDRDQCVAVLVLDRLVELRLGLVLQPHNVISVGVSWGCETATT